MRHKFIALNFNSYSTTETESRSVNFYNFMNQRRSVRAFSSNPVSKKTIENIIMTASSAPSGANKQPWTFCAISNPEVKKAIRKAAEEEEYKNYHGRMSNEWIKDLEPFETDWQKPFLEIAPWLIVVFRRIFEKSDGMKRSNYYVNESVGIASGMLLAAIHNAGLAALTHTPSPMAFLGKILNRPDNERAFLLIPVGYPAKGVKVPDLKRKSNTEVIEWF